MSDQLTLFEAPAGPRIDYRRPPSHDTETPQCSDCQHWACKDESASFFKDRCHYWRGKEIDACGYCGHFTKAKREAKHDTE